MQVQSLNILSNLNSISLKGNKKEKLSNIDTKMQADSFDASEKYSGVTLSRKHDDSVFPSFYRARGYINGRMVNMKVDCTTKALFFRDYSVNGILGDDEINLKADIKGVRGTVGGKEVDLQYHKPLSFTKQSFSGKIGDKEINFTNGDSLDAADGEEDILALAFFLEGNEVYINDGKLKLGPENFFDAYRSELIRQHEQ